MVIMLNQQKIKDVIVNGLQSYLSTPEKPCAVIRANQTGKIPKYPYVAYTVTTPVQNRAGTYSVAEDGTKYKSFLQTWSFTVNSDNYDECQNIVYKAFDWFSEAGLVYLNDNDVIVHRLGNVNNRDNLITLQYEYRSGFDVHFGLVHTITMTEEEIGGYIETANLTLEEE